MERETIVHETLAGQSMEIIQLNMRETSIIIFPLILSDQCATTTYLRETNDFLLGLKLDWKPKGVSHGMDCFVSQ